MDCRLLEEAGKCRAMAEGDENTRFFHGQASHRRRGKVIRFVDASGEVVVLHPAKVDTLLSFYSGLLGRPTTPA